MIGLATYDTIASRTAAPRQGHGTYLGLDKARFELRLRMAGHRSYLSPRADAVAVIDPTVIARVRAHRIAGELAEKQDLVAALYADCERRPLAMDAICGGGNHG